MYSNNENSINLPTDSAQSVSILLGLLSEYSDREKVFETEDIVCDEPSVSYSKITIYVSTPEQFVTTLKLRTSRELEIIINNNLYFQEDPLFKEGFLNRFYIWDCSSITYNTKDNKEIIIQGIQVTGDNFFYFYYNAGVTRLRYFNNIYFKDCVHTKTKNNSYTFDNLNHNKHTVTFTNCKLSMHIRASEYGYQFDSNWIILDHCARYIEYSDLVEDNVPCGYQDSIIFCAATRSTSTIIRNAAYYIGRNYDGNPYTSGFVVDSVNSSWDVEFYTCVFHNMQGGTIYYIDFSDIVNCFISVKIFNRSGNAEFPAIPVSFNSNVSGVNVYNKGNDDDSWRALAQNHNNVKQLTDDECHSAAVLNKYGFFVNQAYTYVLLEEEPVNWETDYTNYYYKDNNEYIKIMAPTAPTWTENTYYSKQYL